MRNKTYLPMELVDVEPVRIKKITDEQRAMMCRKATMSSNEYQKSIKNIRQDGDKQQFENDPFVAAWNMKVDVRMIQVPGRVLPMPSIVYSKSFRVTRDTVRDVGAWEIRHTHFFKPANFPDCWKIINFSTVSQEVCCDFYHELSLLAAERGMKCSPPVAYNAFNDNLHSLDKTLAFLKTAIEQHDECQFYLVILPSDANKRTQIYQNMKRLVRKRHFSMH